jgi:hypothetical protein
VQQIAEKYALSRGCMVLDSDPWIIESEYDAEALVQLLVDPNRKLPVFALSVAETSIDQYQPLIDARSLGRATLGLAQVAVVPAPFTWGNNRGTRDDRSACQLIFKPIAFCRSHANVGSEFCP